MSGPSNLPDGVLPELRIEPLALPAPGFEAFTFPRYRPLLLGTEQPETTQERLAAGAWLGDTPVGLAFFSRQFGDNKNRRLLSVMVSPVMRWQGLGTRLLAAGEELAREQGTQKLIAFHSSRMPAFEAYEALLRKAGWSKPEELEYRLAGKSSWAMQAARDWAPFLARLGERGYGSTTWNDISDQDRERIALLVAKELTEKDQEFDPLKVEKKVGLVKELSLVLRRDGEVVGWILCMRGLMPDTFHYSSGYALPSVRRAGWLMGGVREVCQRQAELFGGDTLSVLETSPRNQGMRRFMERQLKPYSEWTDSRYLSEKLFAAACGGAGRGE